LRAGSDFALRDFAAPMCGRADLSRWARVIAAQ
jgi:hypothetical protein